MLELIQDNLTATGGIVIFLVLLALVPIVLVITLFFKIWIMTNDVSKIRDILENEYAMQHPYQADESVENKEKPTIG